ncbi:uncharacterized protein LOC130666699 isoform X1 [Microplitis mediator]|uniref:uncharacterized protein LOC130666699 isoform X1 n=2 Tax=Microplitis mediator TaxID=375433 RepID=UPI002555F6A3|nr:uncharacterized protein LOC130666699 isoform X1 [Microplitis mediator]
MAKLHSYYTLCPLIDQQSLLGVEKDSDSGCAIITLGRNIAIRYKLDDSKQVSSWSSKKRFTSQVIYDEKSNHYAAIFNEKYIEIWDKNEVDLDKLKKYKFSDSFYAIITLENNSPVLVKENGATASLNWALDNRNTWSSNKGFLKPSEKFIDCKLIQVNNKTYLCALTKIATKLNYIVVELEDETYLENNNQTITRIELKRKSERLVGHVIRQDKNNAYLLTLWSHGRLYSYPLTCSSSEPPPGTLISVFSFISTNHPVAMISLNEATIAVYAADANEEGAILSIYNIEFKLVEATQKLKLYTKDAKLWCIDDKLLLAANRHLAVAPFKLASQKMDTMLGSSLRFNNNNNNNNKIYKSIDNDNDIIEIRETVIANWDNSSTNNVSVLSNKLLTINKGLSSDNIIKQINILLNEGASDAAIHQTLMPQLIESNDIKSILWCINNFKDLPEKILVDLLAFGLRTNDETFSQTIQSKTSTFDNESSIITKYKFLDTIFKQTFSDLSLLVCIKSTLTFIEILTIIDYIIEKLNFYENSNDNLIDKQSDKHLYEWVSLLLDSHYQHYLLSQDTQVIVILKKLHAIINDHFQIFKDIQDLRPMLQRIINGKSLKPSRKDFNKFYSIEQIKLY